MFLENFLKELLTEFKTEILTEVREIVESYDPTETQEWLTEREVRERLDLKRGTLYKLRKEGILNFSQFNRKIYYRQEDIDRFLAQNYSGKLKSGRSHG